ncbi:multidrug ABC transporter permease [Spirochaetia bacterium]|nr:multidrug ABC transporter permease [Spirochaetia bacterium]
MKSRTSILEQRAYTSRDLVLLMFRVSPFYSLITIIQEFIGALTPTITIIATAGFIDAALAVAAGTKPLSAIALPIGALMGVMLYQSLFQNVLMSYVNCRRNIFFRRTLRPQIVAAVAALEYRHIENQDTADLIKRVAPDFDFEIINCFSSVMNLARVVVSTVGVILTLGASCWWAALIIVVSSVPLMFIAKKAGEETYETDREVTKIRRRAEYISQVLTSREAVEERTVYGYTGALNTLYLERFNRARKISLRVSFKNFVKQKAGGVFGSVIAVVTILTMIPSALDGRIEYGMFIALMGGIFALVSSLSWGINWQIAEIARKKEYLKDLTKLMALETVTEAITESAAGMGFDKIEFRSVSFTYPGTDKKILDGVNFEIERGRHYSFVGINGAGKTTITKLLTGLYTNYEGEILIDGRPLRDFPQAEMKGLSTVVYQDFAKYSFSLYDNIAIGAAGATETEVNAAIDLIALREAVTKLPDGAQTNLGKIYENGVDLSGGEWQRVAMARSLVSKAPLRILDEPTAALDPVSESHVYSQFEQISQGKTTIFISHRLGSTKLADTIFVLADGKIAETGSHRALMDLKGLYAEMYSAQADWYVTKEAENG